MIILEHLKYEKGTEEYANFVVLTAVLTMILFFGIYHVKWDIVFDVLAETTASNFMVTEEE
jgi:hypothetical protein